MAIGVKDGEAESDGDSQRSQQLQPSSWVHSFIYIFRSTSPYCPPPTTFQSLSVALLPLNSHPRRLALLASSRPRACRRGWHDRRLPQLHCLNWMAARCQPT